MSEEGIDKFFAIARERYQILLNRRVGMSKPWSQDPIFQSEYFCNVFREDDRTTKWFRENVRDKLKNDPREALTAIVAFRWFNKIETGEKIKEFLLGEWDSVKVYNRLQAQKPVVTGAYIIKTPDGMTKLKGVLWCIDEFLKLGDKATFKDIINGNTSMQEACKILQLSPYLGHFTSYQIVSDARYTALLENAPDINTWAQPGPGSARGIGRIFHNNVEYFNYGSTKDQNVMIQLMCDLLEYSRNSNYWSLEWPKWECSTVQHWACELDKYTRCQEGGRMKRKYNAS